jgi:hypothetical protein
MASTHARLFIFVVVLQYPKLHARAKCSCTFSLIRLYQRRKLVIPSNPQIIYKNMAEEGKTTTFVEDAPTSSTMLSATDHGASLDTGGKGIPDFFGKPQLVYTGAWSASDLQGAYILPLTPGIPLDNLLTTNPVWASKWLGFSLSRADVVIRLQINATPFHQGKLLMHFLPLTTAQTVVAPSYEAMHNFNITTKMMQPHVELDCAETACLMSVPYITPANYFALGGVGSSAYPAYQRGTLQVSVLSPLKTGTGGATTVDYSIFVHFENVELVGPLVPQSGVISKGKFKTRKLGKNAPELELAAMKAGPISGALSTAGTIARALGAVPGLSAIAIPASWVADGMAGIASFFGYSKPMLNNAPTLVARQFQRYAATCDGVDSAYPLAIRSDNAVTLITSKTVYPQDEMSWAFLRDVETVVHTFNWDQGQNDGTALFSQQLSPSLLFTTNSVIRGTKTVTARTGPPIWYLSNIFKFWRGSLKMRLKVVKTNFHSGRLQITYTPKPSATAPTLTTGQYAIRELLDIRTGDEIEMVFPYLLPTDYISLSDAIGSLNIVVLNALRMPQTASNNVDVLIYWSGGDDLEYAVPGYRPGVSNYPPFSPEMDSGPTTLSTGTPGMVEAGPVSMMGAEHCIGEMFSSVRQLLARYNQVWFISALSGTALQIWPYFTSVEKLDATLGLTGASPGGDIFSFMSPMYAFYRGGMRVAINNEALTGNFLATLDSSALQAGGSWFGAPTLSNGSSAPVNWRNFPTTTVPNGTAVTDAGIGLVSVSVPYYCRTPVSMNCPSTTGTVPLVSGALDISQATTAVTLKGLTDASKTCIYRSIAEDFQFQYFVGCPPLVVTPPVGLVGLAAKEAEETNARLQFDVLPFPRF